LLGEFVEYFAKRGSIGLKCKRLWGWKTFRFIRKQR